MASVMAGDLFVHSHLHWLSHAATTRGVQWVLIPAGEFLHFLSVLMAASFQQRQMGRKILDKPSVRIESNVDTERSMVLAFVYWFYLSRTRASYEI